MNNFKKPTDRQKKQPTNIQKENGEFEQLLTQKLQESYFKGVKFGSTMQCSAILDTYKKKLEETPKRVITKEYLTEMINDIFHFCELGVTKDIDFTQFSQKHKEE